MGSQGNDIDKQSCFFYTYSYRKRRTLIWDMHLLSHAFGSFLQCPLDGIRYFISGDTDNLVVPENSSDAATKETVKPGETREYLFPGFILSQPTCSLNKYSNLLCAPSTAYRFSESIRLPLWRIEESVAFVWKAFIRDCVQLQKIQHLYKSWGSCHVDRYPT